MGALASGLYIYIYIYTYCKTSGQALGLTVYIYIYIYALGQGPQPRFPRYSFLGRLFYTLMGKADADCPQGEKVTDPVRSGVTAEGSTRLVTNHEARVTEMRDYRTGRVQVL
jgi:hypothetical protein